MWLEGGGRRAGETQDQMTQRLTGTQQALAFPELAEGDTSPLHVPQKQDVEGSEGAGRVVWRGWCEDRWQRCGGHGSEDNPRPGKGSRRASRAGMTTSGHTHRHDHAHGGRQPGIAQCPRWQ